jgi:hypothetical protein
MPTTSITTYQCALAPSLMTALSSMTETKIEHKIIETQIAKKKMHGYTYLKDLSSTHIPMPVRKADTRTMKLRSHHDPLLNAFINSRL